MWALGQAARYRLLLFFLCGFSRLANMSWSLFSAPHPLVPMTTFSIADEQPAALEECGNQAVQTLEGTPIYCLFPSQEPADSSSQGDGLANFFDSLRHLKTICPTELTSTNSWRRVSSSWNP